MVMLKKYNSILRLQPFRRWTTKVYEDIEKTEQKSRILENHYGRPQSKSKAKNDSQRAIGK